MISDILDEIAPATSGKSHRDLISFVKDRPGHDRRYAIDSTKAQQKLGWKKEIDFETGLKETIEWYKNNWEWWKKIKN